MSREDQIRWDRQHGESPGAEQPSRFLRDIFESGAWEIPPGEALDIACGQGRNAIFLARLGFHVRGVDISPVALAEARFRAEEAKVNIQWQQADLEKFPLPAAQFDLILNFNYLQRSLIGKIKSAIKTGGYVIFETYLIDQAAIGHPKNPDYLLVHNELLDFFRDFRVLSYREGKFSDADEASFRAGLLAQKTR
ncbi:MAG TPA: class I SAM-dependent methyltransferase [Candidatus Binatia bacterium]|nr:class I SAM-dependent methyltransferase [Candidatus Binatia bacterium]